MGDWDLPVCTGVEDRHQALVVRNTPDAGRCYFTTKTICPGEFLLRASGIPTKNDTNAQKKELIDTLALQVLKSIGKMSKSRQIIQQRLFQLYPQSIADVESERRAELQHDVNLCWESIKKTLEEVEVEMDEVDFVLFLLKLNMNSFDCGFFPLACLFNHNCRPNCQGFLRNHGDEKYFEVVSISDIPPGVPLTISYLSQEMLCLSPEQRQHHLAKGYGFVCNCERCTSDENPLLEGLKCPNCEHGVGVYLKNTENSYKCSSSSSCNRYVQMGLRGKRKRTDTGNQLQTKIGHKDQRSQLQNKKALRDDLDETTPTEGCGHIFSGDKADSTVRHLFARAASFMQMFESDPKATLNRSITDIGDAIEVIPLEHWILQLYANQIVRTFRVGKVDSALRRSYIALWVVSEEISLSGFLNHLTKYDYGVSVGYEMSCAAWQGILTLLNEATGLSKDLFLPHVEHDGLSELWLKFLTLCEMTTLRASLLELAQCVTEHYQGLVVKLREITGWIE